MERDANASLPRPPSRARQPPPSLHSPLRTLGEDEWAAIQEAERQLLIQLQEKAAAEMEREHGAEAPGEADSALLDPLQQQDQHQHGQSEPTPAQYDQPQQPQQQPVEGRLGPGKGDGASLPSTLVPRLVPTADDDADAAPLAPPPAPYFFTFGLTGERMDPRAVLATVNDTRLIRAEEEEEGEEAAAAQAPATQLPLGAGDNEEAKALVVDAPTWAKEEEEEEEADGPADTLPAGAAEAAAEAAPPAPAVVESPLEWEEEAPRSPPAPLDALDVSSSEAAGADAVLLPPEPAPEALAVESPVVEQEDEVHVDVITPLLSDADREREEQHQEALLDSPAVSSVSSASMAGEEGEAEGTNDKEAGVEEEEEQQQQQQQQQQEEEPRGLSPIIVLSSSPASPPPPATPRTPVPVVTAAFLSPSFIPPVVVEPAPITADEEEQVVAAAAPAPVVPVAKEQPPSSPPPQSQEEQHEHARVILEVSPPHIPVVLPPPNKPHHHHHHHAVTPPRIIAAQAGPPPTLPTLPEAIHPIIARCLDQPGLVHASLACRALLLYYGGDIRDLTTRRRRGLPPPSSFLGLLRRQRRLERVALERPSHLQRLVTAVALGAAPDLQAIELVAATTPVPEPRGTPSGRRHSTATAAALAAPSESPSNAMVPHAAVESLCTLLEAGHLRHLHTLSLPGKWEKDGLGLLLWTLSSGALPRLHSLALPIQAFIVPSTHERWDGGPECAGAGEEGKKWVEDTHRSEANLRSLADMLEARTTRFADTCDGLRHLDGPWLRCGALGTRLRVLRCLLPTIEAFPTLGQHNGPTHEWAPEFTSLILAVGAPKLKAIEIRRSLPRAGRGALLSDAALLAATPALETLALNGLFTPPPAVHPPQHPMALGPAEPPGGGSGGNNQNAQSDEGFVALLDAAAAHHRAILPSLTSLHFEDWFTSVGHARRVFTALAHASLHAGVGHTIRRLALSRLRGRVGAAPAHAAGVAKALGAVLSGEGDVLPSLEWLSLADSPLGDKGMEAMLQAAVGIDGRSVGTARLVGLLVTGCALGPQGAAALGRALGEGRFAGLRWLHVEYNQEMGDEGFARLVAGLREAHERQSMHHRRHHHHHSSNPFARGLKGLFVRGNGIGDKGALALAEALERGLLGHRLMELVLHERGEPNASVTDEGFSRLALALERGGRRHLRCLTRLAIGCGGGGPATACERAASSPHGAHGSSGSSPHHHERKGERDRAVGAGGKLTLGGVLRLVKAVLENCPALRTLQLVDAHRVPGAYEGALGLVRRAHRRGVSVVAL